MKKIITFLLLLFFVLMIYTVLSKGIDLFSPKEEFIYNLKSAPITPVSYLHEANSRQLPIDKNTIALYSVHQDTSMLERIFKTAGIPYYVCTSMEEIKQAQILFLDLSMNHPVTLTQRQIDQLYDFVAKGGIVIGNEVLATRYGALKALFGYRSYTPSKEHRALHLKHSPYFTFLNQPEERSYQLSTLQQAPFTNAIEVGTAKVLATYEDTQAAITLNHFHKGEAILLGVSLFDLRYRNLFSKDYEANVEYANGYEPLSDMIVFLLKGIYTKKLKTSLMLNTAKGANHASVVITHDVDYEYSMKNIEKFMALEEAQKVKSTYTIQTKYIKDYKDNPFFKADTLQYILDAQAKGFEVASHTVLHTENFFTLPKGDCKEHYPEYKPFSMNALKDSGHPTLCGELKVSKELLLGSGIKEVVSFRSGHLYYNPNLPQVMEALGYRFSSCFSAEDVLSYFPYRYVYDYKTLSHESKIWELPMTYEDEAFPPLYFRVDQALKLFEKLYRQGGVFTLLVHPDLTVSKLKNLDLDFQRSFVEQLPDDVWIDTMKAVGTYWDQRDRIVFRYNVSHNKIDLTLFSAVDMKDVSFVLTGVQLHPGQSDVQLKGDLMILDIKKGLNHWELKRD